MNDTDTEYNQLVKDSKKLSVEELTKTVEKLIGSVGGYTASMIETFRPKGLYRARGHEFAEGASRDGELERFVYESEYWEPPKEKCKLGRCNDDGEQILYCTNEFQTAIIEAIKPHHKFISVANFKRNHESLSSRLMPIGNEYLSKIKGIEHLFRTYDFDRKEFKELDKLLIKLFTSEGNDTRFYKLSTAVTRCMMKDEIYHHERREMQGIMYPSIARMLKSFNVALRPIHAKSIYGIWIVQTLKILDMSAKNITVQLIRNGHPETPMASQKGNSNIIWYEIDNGDICLIPTSIT